jgi:AcrR family transcriptional regulator
LFNDEQVSSLAGMGQEGQEGVPSPHRTQAERRAESEQGLLDSAQRLFAKKGVENTTLAEIGDAAGYSRGLANHHFGSKAALVERLAERSRRRFRTQFRPMSDIRAGNEVEALVRVADAFLATGGKGTDEVRAFFVLWGSVLPDEAVHRDGFIAQDQRVRGFVQRLVQAGQQRGTIRGDLDAAAFAVVYLSLLRGAVPLMLMDQTVSVDKTRAAVADLLRRQLSPASGRPASGRPEATSVSPSGVLTAEPAQDAAGLVGR